VASECGTPPAGAPFPVDGIPFHLRGRIDRIDHHAASGAWAVFDYKTGEQQDEPDNTHRRGRGDDRPWCDLQLPLYRHLLEHVVDAGGARIFSQPPRGELRLGYIRLPRELELVGGCFAEWSADDLASADEAAREVVRLVRRNRFAFDPARLTEFARTDFAALVGVGNLASALDDGGRE
jgi:hypothetical protein